MISIDTNVLVRVLVNDIAEAEQMRAARRTVSVAGEVFISQIVQVETMWVLSSGYKLKKDVLLTLLQHLYENIAYHLEKEASFLLALKMYKNGNADFSDYLILADARKRGLEVATFDKRFARTEGVLLVKDK